MSELITKTQKMELELVRDITLLSISTEEKRKKVKNINHKYEI